MSSRTNPQHRRQAVRTDDRGPGSGSIVAYRDEDGEIREWQGEDLGPYTIAVPAPLSVEHLSLDRAATGGAFANSLVVKTSPGRIYEVHCITASNLGADRYLHVFNAVAAPAGGAVPVWRALIPSGPAGVNAAEAFVVFEFTGIYLSNGIVVALSTTAPTYTAPGANEGLFHVTFK